MDAFSCRALDENHHLQGDFEQKQKGFNALGGVQIDRLDAVGAFGAPIGMLAFVLFLMASMASSMLSLSGC